MKFKIANIALFIIGFSIVISCKKNTVFPTEISDGKLKIVFSHTIDIDSLQKDMMIYHNEAGNQYEINELKYFISDLVLYPHNSGPVIINQKKIIHYIDIDIPNTLNWEVFDALPLGNYDSVSFVFGLNEQRNVSNTFTNSPEVYMSWPDILGGGYHYMMMNGKWKAANNQIKTFNFHFGIGQIYSGTSTSTDSIIGYVHNYFKVCLPTSNFQIIKSQTTILKLNMDINSWFKTPNIYNHDIWGGGIMQNQAAMNSIKENGFDVFSVE